MMKLRSVATIGTIAGTLALSASAHAWVYTTTAQYGSWSGGGYTVGNDIWSGEGNQTLYVNSGSNWELISNNMTGGGVKAYGNSAYYPNYSNLNGACTSYFEGSSNASAYDMAYDIWTDNYVDEIMLWEDWTSNVGPIGSEIASNVTVGGNTWNIYRGNTGHNVVSLLSTSKKYNGTNNVQAIMQYLNSKGWLSSATLYEVAFGYEITDGSNAESYTSSYSVTL
jgi:Glycosyl hydrolase family 12